ncbi:MAG: SDR family NAD(P)-dependent oxidoreductase, partial [Nitratireductor sp.]
MKSVVVTGVSTGIGHAAARVLADKGFHVFGSVRKEADAERLKKELGGKFTPLIFDVTDEAAVRRGAETVRAALKGETLAGLVNNAGIAVSGPLIEVDPDDFRKQMDVNVTGPFLVTQAFAPLLGADSTLKGTPGRIVNISSVGGIRAMPFIGPYAASKFAIEGFSEALRRELMLFEIPVIVIGPGPVKTAIWDKAEEIDIARYSNSPYLPILEKFQKVFIQQGREGYPAERLGRLIH